jgi:hypothetical protein
MKRHLILVPTGNEIRPELGVLMYIDRVHPRHFMCGDVVQKPRGGAALERANLEHAARFVLEVQYKPLIEWDVVTDAVKS